MSWFLALTCLVSADIYQETFTEGNAAYQAGQYAQAAAAYEKLVSASVVDPVVFYDLGNAYYRQGKPGLAIANYERALDLNPNFQQAAENLEKALRGTKRNLARPLPPAWEQAVLFWHYGLSSRATRWAMLASWALFWAGLAAYAWRPHRYLRAALIVAAVASLAFGGSAWAKTHRAPLAVTIVEKADVRFGTSGQETVRFELFEGDRVTVDRREGGWARVTTVGGERGWTQESNLLFVAPPYQAATPETPTS